MSSDGSTILVKPGAAARDLGTFKGIAYKFAETTMIECAEG